MEIRPDVVRNGLSSWERTHAHVSEVQRAAQAAIGGVDVAAVFGGDTAGRTALTSYQEGGGPAQLLFGPQGGGGILGVLGDGGTQMSGNLDAALAQEAANASSIAAAGGAAPPSARA